MSLSRGKYQDLEKEVGEILSSGGPTFVRIVPRYAPGQTRPYEILYQFRYQGRTLQRIFPNP